MYAGVQVDVNVYNYPIEGTLNDNPIYLSDIPRIHSATERYRLAGDGKTLHLGAPDNPVLQGHGVTVFLPFNSLSEHGISLGDPGSGKTNTDLVLASEAAAFLETLVVLDSSGGIAGKLDTLPDVWRSNLHRFRFDAPPERDALASAVLGKGMRLVETTVELMPQVFQEIVAVIESSPDPTTGNKERVIRYLLLVEEAAGVFGKSKGEQEAASARLIQLLSIAFRKGWCVWLSLQRPSMLGRDAKTRKRVLGYLGNRLVGVQKSADEVELLASVFKDEGHTSAEIEYFRRQVGRLTTGSALVRGCEILASKEKSYLPILKTRMRLMDSVPAPAAP
ncbi:MAG TPA: hypothetical protein VGX50_05320 [Longimicrobium sp.]|nr:hypothetical protein [Longimicrobium sp.]